MVASLSAIVLSNCKTNPESTGSICISTSANTVDSCMPPPPEPSPFAAANAQTNLPEVRKPPVPVRPDLAGNSMPGETQPSGQPSSLAQAVRQAIDYNPQIGMALARAREARAGIGVATSALLPQLEGRVAAGPGIGGNYQTASGADFFDPKQTTGSMRSEVGVSARQLLYDFGATQSRVDRSQATYQSETERALDQSDDIAQRVADSYVKIREQQQLITLATENVTELRRIAKLVQDNETNGNATKADTKRVSARLAEAEQSLSDAQLELQIAVDRFQILVGRKPGTLKSAPDLSRHIPPGPAQALELAEARSPRLQAIRASIRAARSEIDAIKGEGKPTVNLEGDYLSKGYSGYGKTSELDARGVIALRYKFADGGLNRSRIEEAAGRLQAEEFRLLYEKDQLSGDLRQSYQAIASSRGKTSMINTGLEASEKARALYLEQFGGGKRTLLELLDVQASWYLARRNQITNQHEEMRAVYAILRSMGRLTQSILGQGA
jgi:TolC family type I secretion outer membrane protein